MTNFIDEEKLNDGFDTDMPVHYCRFNKELYRDELYQAFGIKYPDSLHNSVTKRRAEFLAGRYCAVRSLQKLGIENTTIEIGKHRNPLWPQNVVGSISHCGTHAVAITGNASTVTGVGIDIEDEIDGGTAEKIQSQILSEDEIRLISQKRDEKPLLFTLAFSVKESFFKAAYPAVGRYFVFDALSLVGIDRQARTVSLRINDSLHDTLTKGRLIQGAFRILEERKVMTLVILNL